MTVSAFGGSTFLVPVDFDEPSKAAVEIAATYARTLGARLVVLHVVPPSALPEGTRVLPTERTDPVDLAEYVSARARQMLDHYFVDALSAGIEVRKEARTGHPVATILRAIEEDEARLVFVGTHGRTGTARVVLGSVAEAVVRRSPVPVLVARVPDVADGVPRPAKGGTITGAAVLSGAVAGAATGALAGPVGAVAGGAIGTVLGAVAGRAMAREDARQAERDRTLDDEIGVTRGSLGTPPETKKPSEPAESGRDLEK